jgi:hypothetical protein
LPDALIAHGKNDQESKLGPSEQIGEA